MVCSEKCLQKLQYKTYTKYGSHIDAESLDILTFIDKIVEDFWEAAGCSVEEMRAIHSSQERKTIFDVGLSDSESPEQRENRLKCFLSLYDKPANPDPIRKFINSSYIKQRLHAMDIPKSPWNVEFFLKFYNRIMDIYDSNSVSMHTMNIEEHKKGECNIFGKAILLFGSFFNHSCDPNVDAICYENKFVYAVNRPVKAGEQLFVSYRSVMVIVEYIWIGCNVLFTSDLLSLKTQKKNVKKF